MFHSVVGFRFDAQKPGADASCDSGQLRLKQTELLLALLGQMRAAGAKQGRVRMFSHDPGNIIGRAGSFVYSGDSVYGDFGVASCSWLQIGPHSETVFIAGKTRHEAFGSYEAPNIVHIVGNLTLTYGIPELAGCYRELSGNLALVG